MPVRLVERYDPVWPMWFEQIKAFVDAILKEFYTKFFGLADGPMGGYLEMVDAAFRDTDCHTGSSFCLPRIFTSERRTQARNFLEEAGRLAGGDGTYARRVRIYRVNYDRLVAFLEMLDARNRFDFAAAKEALDRLDHLTRTMLDFRLYPNPSGKAPVETFDSRLDREARLLWWRSALSYIDRFWSPCTESGYERTIVRGEFVAGGPDEWDFLIDPTDVGEASGWFRDGPVGGNWQKLRTTSASWSDQGLHYYKGLAWYRTQVEIPKRFKRRKIYLWFGGVDE
ncbi:MAG TPA: hypothetical protein EYP62_08405, partial [Kiritimatiellae bacterium]|nr:hypothetical protein [Kiritimatiellia bacterium]